MNNSLYIEWKISKYSYSLQRRAAQSKDRYSLYLKRIKPFELSEVHKQNIH